MGLIFLEVLTPFFMSMIFTTVNKRLLLLTDTYVKAHIHPYTIVLFEYQIFLKTIHGYVSNSMNYVLKLKKKALMVLKYTFCS